MPPSSLATRCHGRRAAVAPRRRRTGPSDAAVDCRTLAAGCPTARRAVHRFLRALGSARAAAKPGARLGEERRVVTVVFADLVGFTALAERTRSRAGEVPGRRAVRAAGRGRDDLRRPGRQDPRRRHRRLVRRAGGPRGRRRAGGAGLVADAAFGHRAGGRPRRADPDADRREHRRGARRRAARRRRLHGHGRRREHRVPPADRRAARRRAGRAGDARGHGGRHRLRVRAATSRSGAATSRWRRGWPSSRSPCPAGGGGGSGADRGPGARTDAARRRHAGGPPPAPSGAGRRRGRGRRGQDPAGRGGALGQSRIWGAPCSSGRACPTARPTAGGRSPARSARCSRSSLAHGCGRAAGAAASTVCPT